jgi:hypothetical protein
MINSFKSAVLILATIQFCSLGFTQQDYRIEEVTEWNLQTVNVHRETNQAILDASKKGLSYREERITVKKPLLEKMIRVEQNIVYNPVLIPTPFQPATNSLGLSIPQRKIQWNRGGYRVDPMSGQATYQRGGLRWNTDSTNSTANQKPLPYVPAFSYQPEVVETRTPVYVTRYVDEVVTRKIPHKPKVALKTFERLVAVRVRYKTPINAAGDATGPTIRIVVPAEATSASLTSVPDATIDEVSFRANKNSERSLKPPYSILKSKPPLSTLDGFPGLLKTTEKSQPLEPNPTLLSNFQETTSVNGARPEQAVETLSAESPSTVPTLETNKKSVWSK